MARRSAVARDDSTQPDCPAREKVLESKAGGLARTREEWDRAVRNIAKLRANGVPIVYGSDSAVIRRGWWVGTQRGNCKVW